MEEQKINEEKIEALRLVMAMAEDASGRLADAGSYEDADKASGFAEWCRSTIVEIETEVARG